MVSVDYHPYLSYYPLYVQYASTMEFLGPISPTYLSRPSYFAPIESIGYAYRPAIVVEVVSCSSWDIGFHSSIFAIPRTERVQAHSEAISRYLQSIWLKLCRITRHILGSDSTIQNLVTPCRSRDSLLPLQCLIEPRKGTKRTRPKTYWEKDNANEPETLHTPYTCYGHTTHQLWGPLEL
jgi:hypothetical protein